jgi:hypothetical protein
MQQQRLSMALKGDKKILRRRVKSARGGGGGAAGGVGNAGARCQCQTRRRSARASHATTCQCRALEGRVRIQTFGNNFHCFETSFL